MYVVPISAKSYAFCAMLPMVSQVTSMPACHLVQYRVCYLPPTRQTTTMEPLVDYPRQHIKHAHSSILTMGQNNKLNLLKTKDN